MLALTRARKITQAQTPTPASKIPVDAVFTITELLEEILQHLSWKELFIVQRTCRRFQRVISGSSPLQQKITLFRPETGVSLENDLPSANHGLRSFRKRRADDGRADHGLNEGQRVCPLLRPWPPFNAWKTSQGPRPVSIPFTFDLADGERWKSPASWSQVYLTDPPVTEVKVRLLWRVKDAGFYSFFHVLRDEEGITFGKLLELSLEMEASGGIFTGFTHRVGDFNRRILDVRGSTPAEVISRLERRLGGRANLQSGKSYVMFDCSSSL